MESYGWRRSFYFAFVELDAVNKLLCVRFSYIGSNIIIPSIDSNCFHKIVPILHILMRSRVLPNFRTTSIVGSILYQLEDISIRTYIDFGAISTER